MKKVKYVFFILILLVIAGLTLYYFNIKYPTAEFIGTGAQGIIKKDRVKEGDIIFQISLSTQSKAIQQVTKSEYSHCGIIYKNNGKYYVYEAVQPVKLTPLEKWIARGKDGHYVIKRLKDDERVLTPDNLKKMRKEGEKFIGKSYDLTFGWSDDKIYCSELIWKIYKRGANIEIGQLEQLGNLDLTGKEVRQKLKERYGDKVPKDEIVISPAAIFNSNMLETVVSN